MGGGGLVRRFNWTLCPCVVAKEIEFWKVIMSIILQRKIAWCVGGDFNWVMQMDERRGYASSSRGIPKFCEFVCTAALSNVPLQGKAFTWFGSENKCSRLDRFLVSNEWFQRFDSLAVISLPRELFDHSPILLVSDACDSGSKLL
ncbi:hypothetical protein V6N13_114145 [Hibiscus sabdariffa]|uniref:Reverse transcriptase n=1 Tax=Hibiscus sabdariffa TaxID=183260 RepID=A0ABR2U0Y4_9ROSI